MRESLNQFWVTFLRKCSQGVWSPERQASVAASEVSSREGSERDVVQDKKLTVKLTTGEISGPGAVKRYGAHSELEFRRPGLYQRQGPGSALVTHRQLSSWA